MLADIEDHLGHADPSLARTLEDGCARMTGPSSPGRRRCPPWPLLLAVAAVLVLVAVVAGLPGLILALGTGAALGAAGFAVHATHRRASG